MLGGGSIRPHYNLNAWKEAMSLVKAVHEFTETLLPSEKYGLVAQMRRAGVSIPSNIAEGAARTSAKEFAQFLSIAKGSLSELETQSLITRDLGYATAVDELLAKASKVSRLLSGLRKSISK